MSGRTDNLNSHVDVNFVYVYKICPGYTALKLDFPFFLGSGEPTLPLPRT